MTVVRVMLVAYGGRPKKSVVALILESYFLKWEATGQVNQ